MTMLTDVRQPGTPVLPNSYFWTWDHSTNWVLDDPGNQTRGCYNAYLKRPETYIEDYRRLTDAAAALGVRGIIIWGFLRDAHGGVEFSKRVASYAADKGVAIMPGCGTTWYGGVYYEGDHPYRLETFLEKHPDARMLNEKGEPQAGGACPVHPAYHAWLRESLEWLFREFEIGGLNIENGDFLVDHHPLTQEARKDWPADDAEPFFFQGLSYMQAVDILGPHLVDKLITYATYSGFNYGTDAVQNSAMGSKPPAMLDRLHEQSICQWTLSGMVLETPLPLAAYLDDGEPAAAFDNPNWPAELKPACRRNVGFVHQGSQWCNDTRYNCIVSTIKEACLRAHRTGLEGVSIHGEVSALHVPYALNYLAFSHFIHRPADTLREFGRRTLGQVLASEQHGEEYAECLAHWDAGTLTDDHRKLLADRVGPSYSFHGSLADHERMRLWQWLHAMSEGRVEKHTMSLQV